MSIATEKKIMKVQMTFVFLIGFFFIPSAQAKWIVKVYTGKEAPRGVQSLSVVQKTIETPAGTFVTGLITNTVIQRSDLQKSQTEKQDPDSMAEQVRLALQTGPWVKEKIDGIHFYTLKWKEARRYLRLIIQKDKDHVRVSFANLRQPYVFQESLETDLLQRAFFKIESKRRKSASIWPLLWKDLMPEAQSGSLTTADLQRAYQGFMGSLDQIARNAGYNSAKELASGLQGLGADVQGAARAGATSINNLADSVRSTFNFMNGVKFGAGMGFGFAAGSAVANLVMDQGAKILRNAYYAITNKMKPEERALLDVRVGKALDVWARETDQLQEIEKELSVYEMAFTGAFLLPPERALDSVAKAQERQIDLENQLNVAKEKLSKLSGSDREACISNINQLENQLVFTNTILGKLIDSNGNKDKMCQQMSDLLSKWARSEASLYQAKMIISVERTTILGQLERQQLEALSNPVDSSARENECRANRMKLASASEESFQTNNCPSKPGDASCALIQRQIEEWKVAAKDCPAEVAKGLSGLSERDVARSGEALKQYHTDAALALDSMAAADCQAQETGGKCAGKVGLIADLRNTYEAKVSSVRQHCPQLNFQLPAQNFAKASYQEGFPNPQNDLRNMNRAPQPLEPQKSSGGVFNSLGNFLKRLWNGIFG